jgi:TonB family protein
MRRSALAGIAVLPLLAAVPAKAADAAFCNAPGMTQPMPLTSHAPPPELYPPLSAMMGESGNTLVRYTVLASGIVGDASIERSSGSLRLDDAAVAFVKAFRFKPAMLDGKPVDCSRQIVIRWSLEDSSPLSMAQIGGTPFYPTLEDFPPGAVDRHEDGTVIAMVLLGDKGTIETILPMLGSKFADLNSATVDYIRKQKIAGPTVNGVPVRAALVIRVVWSPTGRPADAAGDTGQAHQP